MIFGDRVNKLRKKLSLSKTELADRVGVSIATISNWENWKSTPTRNNLEILALMLSTTTDYLEGITDGKRPPAFRRGVAYEAVCSSASC